MRNNYLIAFGTLLLTITTIVGKPVYANISSADSAKKTIQLKDNRPNRPQFESVIDRNFESFMLKVSAIKPASSKTQNTANNAKTTVAIEANKSIDNVKVYPNPVSTQLNLSYTLSKESLVTVKIVDVLGNEVITLLSQKLNSGEQTNSFNLTSKLNSGLYFVRIVAGSESVIKRISVL